MTFIEKLHGYQQSGSLPKKIAFTLEDFYKGYIAAVSKQHQNLSGIESNLRQYLDLVVEQIACPSSFDLFHKRVTEPFNFYRFGLDIIKPLVLSPSSKVFGLPHIQLMTQQLARKENVILFANHQTETDPQIINLLLEETYPKFAEEMIFLAGQRVTTDPLAVPFSLGCNLLSVYSKRYIEHPPEERHQKLLHNQRTMKQMQQLLLEGGKCIYVAPSGGRDRKNPDTNQIEIAPFDPQSIEMIYLIAQQTNHPTHFYPLSLATYEILPPPQSIEKKLGEKRPTSCCPAFLYFGEEIVMENFPGMDDKDKKINRQKRADFIWGIVKKQYEQFHPYLEPI